MGVLPVVPLKGQKRALDALQLELQTFVSCVVGAENRTQVLCKESQSSSPPSLQPSFLTPKNFYSTQCRDKRKSYRAIYREICAFSSVLVSVIGNKKTIGTRSFVYPLICMCLYLVHMHPHGGQWITHRHWPLLPSFGSWGWNSGFITLGTKCPIYPLSHLGEPPLAF